MNTNSIYILGVRIDPITIKDLNKTILAHVQQNNREPLVIFKPYVEFLSLAARNPHIKDLLNKSDINAADSTAVQWAASYLYGNPPTSSNSLSTYRSLLFNLQTKQWRDQVVPERMAGVDQTLPLLRDANRLKLKIGVIGGPKDIQKTRDNLKHHFGELDVKVWSGYFNARDEASLIQEVAEFEPDILFCAMGFPKHEQFIVKNRNRLNSRVIIGEGGSFDYDQLGGKTKRAPRWMRKIGLEWMWRLLLQPKRVGRQIAIPTFIHKVQKQRRSQK